LIAKTKRIAERSDTNCDTHTDRQSTLDEYMIDIQIIFLVVVSQSVDIQKQRKSVNSI
jgi:hypothetical protein